MILQQEMDVRGSILMFVNLFMVSAVAFSDLRVAYGGIGLVCTSAV